MPTTPMPRGRPPAAPAPAGAGADASHDDAAGGLTIGELAARVGVGADAIRYYERAGVLPRPARGTPGVTHPGSRRYTAADVRRLAFVRRARALGFALEEVRELLALAGEPTRPCSDVDRLARAHLAAVEAKLAKLAALRAELVRLIGNCHGGVAVVDCRILGALGVPTTNRGGSP